MKNKNKGKYPVFTPKMKILKIFDFEMKSSQNFTWENGRIGQIP